MSTDSEPIVKFEQRGPITIGTVHSTEMLDGMNVNDFGNELLTYVEANPGSHLLVDFESVRYMSSAGLTELLRINEALKKSNGSVRLCGLSKDIRKVFQITNLEKLFVIHEGDHVANAAKRFERSLAIAAEEDAWAHPDAGS